MAVYPNPATDHLVIDHSGVELESIILLDIAGREISQQRGTGSRSTIDLAGLPSGPYLLKLVSETGMDTRLVMKE